MAIAISGKAMVAIVTVKLPVTANRHKGTSGCGVVGQAESGEPELLHHDRSIEVSTILSNEAVR